MELRPSLPRSVLPLNVTTQVILSIVLTDRLVGKTPLPFGCATPLKVTLFVCNSSDTAFTSSWTGWLNRIDKLTTRERCGPAKLAILALGVTLTTFGKAPTICTTCEFDVLVAKFWLPL